MVKHILVLSTIVGHQLLMQLEILVFLTLTWMLGIMQINSGVVINHFTLMMILVGIIQFLVLEIVEVAPWVLIVFLVKQGQNQDQTMI